MRVMMLLAALLAAPTTAWAQGRIGYTDLELVMASMPETKKVNATLEALQQELAGQMKVRRDYARVRYEEVVEKQQANQLSEEQAQVATAELTKLQNEIDAFEKASEQKLLSTRASLVDPLLERLQKAIAEVAAERGYTVVLNRTSSAGVSAILFGPPEDDITKPLCGKLGIPVPDGLR